MGENKRQQRRRRRRTRKQKVKIIEREATRGEKQHKQHLTWPSFRVVETVVLVNGRFVPCRKRVVLTKIGGNSDIAFYPQKQGILLLKPQKSAKMTKMAGVPLTKWPFAKSTGLTTLNYGCHLGLLTSFLFLCFCAWIWPVYQQCAY